MVQLMANVRVSKLGKITFPFFPLILYDKYLIYY